MTRCTWQSCPNEATHPQVSKDQGDTWAELCDDHSTHLRAAIVSGDEARLAQAWVLAQGGPRAAQQRISKRRLYQMGVR